MKVKHLGLKLVLLQHPDSLTWATMCGLCELSVLISLRVHPRHGVSTGLTPKVLLCHDWEDRPGSQAACFDDICLTVGKSSKLHASMSCSVKWG